MAQLNDLIVTGSSRFLNPINGNARNGVYYVKGTQTGATGSWTGAIPIPALYDGLTIMYYLPFNGSGNATLNLTLSDGTTTGAKNCYYNTGRLTTHYGAGCNILMTYHPAGSITSGGSAITDDRWIADANYDTNTTYSMTRDGESIKLTPSSGSAQSISLSSLINGLGEGSSPAQQDDYLVAQYAGGGTTTTSYHRRKVSNIVNATNVKTALGTGSGTTKFLREDGTWQTPPSGSDTTYTLGTSGNNVTLTPSSGSVQSITVPYATSAGSATDNTKVAKAGDTMTGALKVGNPANTSTFPTVGLTVHDTRGVAQTPSPMSNAVNFFFSNNTMPDSKWWAGMHINGWTGAYNAWELVGPAHNDDARTRPLYVRSSNTNTAWGSWRKIYDTSNPPTASELAPIVHKKYESTSYYSTNDSYDNSTWYFASIRPDAWYKPWSVKFKIHTYCPNYSSYESYTWSTVSGREQSYVYANWNERYDSAHYYETLYMLKKAGFDAGYGHALGISIRYGSNYQNSAYYRTFEIDYLECENCTVTILDTPVKWANWTGTGTTNYNGLNTLDAVSRGLQESGDSNDQAYQVRDYYNRFVAGSNKVFPYTIIMQIADGRWESIVTSSTTGTKSRNTHGFRLGQLALMYGGSTYNENAVLGDATVYEAYTLGLADHRYSFNTANDSTNGTTANKPIYLVGTLNATDGLFYLDTTWWTQTLPSTDNGKLYIYIGDAYDYYRMSFPIRHPVYRYVNGAIREFSQDASTVNGLAVLPLAGGTMTGQLKTSFKSSVATGSQQADASTIPDLCTELRYSSGVMGSANISTSYTKDGVTIATGWYNFLWVPHRSGGVNGQASGDNCNYGSLYLSGMTTSGCYMLRFASGNIAELKDLYKDTNTTYTFASGTNGFTVAPSGGSAQTVTVTPSISNNVTGSGTSGYLAKFNGANTITNAVALGSDTTKFLRNDGTWQVPSTRQLFFDTPAPPYALNDLWFGDGSIRYCTTARASGVYVEDDWTVSVDESFATSLVEETVSCITGNSSEFGGRFIIELDSENNSPLAVVFACDTTITSNTKLWRFDANGFRFSSDGGQTYSPITNTNGELDASYITSGVLDASRVSIINLNTSDITTGDIYRGGTNNTLGTLVIKNQQNEVIGEINKLGIKIYGQGDANARPYIIFNDTEFFAGYDANGNQIFKVVSNVVNMVNASVTSNLTVGNKDGYKISFVPITIKDANDVIVNDGVAIV